MSVAEAFEAEPQRSFDFYEDRMSGRARPQKRASLEIVGLFAGIGGLERGLGRSGHRPTTLVELDGPARAVLESQYRAVSLHDDVRTYLRLPEGTDVLAGGFPCQDLSQAGRTHGIEGTRSGLVGEVFRLLQVQPVKWVVLENVPFMLQLGRGRALDVIMTAFEELGYRWAYRVVDSRAFGVPQRRRRVVIVASREEDPRTVLFADEAGPKPEPERQPDSWCGFYWTEGVRGLGWAVDAVPTLKGGSTVGVPSPPAIWTPEGDLVTPDIRDAERLQGFPADWTKGAERVGKRGFRWKLVGNAVTVPMAAWLGRRLARPGDFELEGAHKMATGRAWPTCGFFDGRQRWTAHISEWPKHHKMRRLGDFLQYPTQPLSERAARGFLQRTRKASLRFPDGFIDAVEAYARRFD
jgi:DNA (cytosine-5)-methyltransferase 1